MKTVDDRINIQSWSIMQKKSLQYAPSVLIQKINTHHCDFFENIKLLMHKKKCVDAIAAGLASLPCHKRDHTHTHTTNCIAIPCSSTSHILLSSVQWEVSFFCCRNPSERQRTPQRFDRQLTTSNILYLQRETKRNSSPKTGLDKSETIILYLGPGWCFSITIFPTGHLFVGGWKMWIQQL